MPRKIAKDGGTGRLRLNRAVDTRVIYCGDNADVLKEKIPDGCIDLVYIDPPFCSGQDYEILWKENWERRAFGDRHGSMADYIRFMEERCYHLARVLKPTGSFYIHCDYHANHHLRTMLDRVFGDGGFRNEIVWRRATAKTQSHSCYPTNHDTILFYAAGLKNTFHRQFSPHSDLRVEKHFGSKNADGHRFSLSDLTGAGKRNGETGKPWRGFNPNAINRHWGRPPADLDILDADGRIYWPKRKGAWPRLRRYLHEMRGVQVDSVWTDIPPINARATERVGYPTQKPLALLERIIKSSTNPGDIVLDAFCGCGTTLEAAEMLGRQWIGIDFSPTACSVMARRLERRCKIKQDETLWRADRGFVVKGMPTGLEQLEKMDPSDFQNWALIAIAGYPNKTKVADYGIDGRLYPANDIMGAGKGASGEQLEFTVDSYYPVQAKQVKRVGRPDIDKFETAMRRVDAHRGIFVAFGYSRDSIREIERFKRQEGRTIHLLTVAEILDAQERQRAG